MVSTDHVHLAVPRTILLQIYNEPCFRASCAVSLVLSRHHTERCPPLYAFPTNLPATNTCVGSKVDRCLAIGTKHRLRLSLSCWISPGRRYRTVAVIAYCHTFLGYPTARM